ncbi:ribose-phosphate pyrophosphokinase [Alteromonas sp.]|nr:ribose-phosphate pyrophosphokinase [Alteromonas sp.]
MQLRQILIPFTLCAVLLSLSACSDEQEMKPTSLDEQNTPALPTLDSETEKAMVEQKTENADMDESTVLTGMIVYKELEGGFFAFIADNGDRFTLHGLSDAYKKNGLIVEITGNAKPDMMTITQFGTVFEIQEVTVIDASKVIDGANTF